MKQTERNFWLDVILFVAFLFTFITGFATWLLMKPQISPSFSGFNREFLLIVHICSSLASMLCTVIHVVWHKEWLSTLRGRSIISLPRKLRANRILDRIIWISFLGASGFSLPGLIFPVAGYRVSILSRLHVAFGIIFLVGIIVHLIFHRKWIGSTIKRNLMNQRGSLENIQSEMSKN